MMLAVERGGTRNGERPLTVGRERPRSGRVMNEFSVSGQRVVVMGSARSGTAAATLLAERGAHVTLSELHATLADPHDAARLRDAGVNLELGGHDGETLRGASLIVLSPGVPLSQPALAAARLAGVPVIGEVELAARWLKGRIVAITGTKGKSTTTTLAGRMLEAAGITALVGGNIGLPLSAQVANSTSETIHVVEVSSFQLETIETFHPWIAVLLNFSPDHLDRHVTVEAYARAKARVFENQDERDWSVVNADDPAALALARAGRGRQVLFSSRASLDEGVFIGSNDIVYRGAGRDEPLIPLSAIKLIGPHLVADVAAAAAVAKLSGVSAAAMTRAAASFTGLEHALESVAEVRGIRFVNDSKATNVEAALRAIESFPAGLVVILGGRYKGGDFRRLRDGLLGRRATVVAIGEAQSRIAEALADVVPVQNASSMAEAVRRAFEEAPPGGTVLLAPACASFDMFTDYAERGRAFKQEVVRLIGASSE
jgi:UDP-N-acetylmuramoylalanine--D-glutamate ligase